MKIKKEPYAGALKKLSQKAERKARADLNKKIKVTMGLVKKQGSQKQMQVLRALNQKAQAKAAALKSRVRRPRPTGPAGPAGVSRPNLPNPSPLARINRISPYNAIVGRTITISGEHFGDTRRKVFRGCFGSWYYV